MDLRVHRIPWSTNVERVALAAGHKGIEVEWVDHDPADRAALVALSGQELVPIAEIGGEVIADSTRIIERLEELVPEPRLYPAEPSHRAGVEIFIEWFNEVWKGPPNAIEAELGKPSPDLALVEALSARLFGWLPKFEALLSETDYLLGPDFTAGDVIAYPFLRYAVSHDPDDQELFHQVLVEHMPVGTGFPKLRGWVERCDARPRA